MMHFIGIDLAERHSAAVCVDENLNVVWETYLDAGEKEKGNPFPQLHAITGWWWEILDALAKHAIPVEETVVAVEKPFHHARNAESALVVLGGLLTLMAAYGWEAHLVTPKEWQVPMGLKREFDPKRWATSECEDRGYEPGALIEGRVLARPKCDLRDAYLLSCWLQEQVLHP